MHSCIYCGKDFPVVEDNNFVKCILCGTTTRKSKLQHNFVANVISNTIGKDVLKLDLKLLNGQSSFQEVGITADMCRIIILGSRLL